MLGSSFSVVVEALRPHYAEAYRSLSRTMLALLSLLEEIKLGSSSSSAARYSMSADGRYDALLPLDRSMAALCGTGGAPLEDLSLPSHSLKAMVDNYLDLIGRIRSGIRAHRSSPTFTREMESKNTNSEDNLVEIMSNREMKVINAVLMGTRDLMTALEDLLSVVHRMHSHREIRMNQDGRTLP
jgi:hypothetical protein